MIKNRKKKVAIFDVDGTLIDSTPKIIEDIKRVYNHFNKKVTDLEITNSGWYELAQQYGISKEEFDREFDKRKSWIESLEDGEVPIFEDVIPCLEKLCSDGVILGVLTRSIPEYTKQKLGFYNLIKYFKENIAITDINLKSKRDEALELIKKINPSIINTTYFIGDRVEDILVEKDINDKYQLNSNGIWVNREKKATPKELINYKQVSSLIEIPKIIGA